MFTAIKGIIPLVSAVFMAVTANIGDTNNELYYYNLRFLKKSGPPRIMEMVKIDNMTHKKPLSMKGFLVTYNNRDAKKAAIAGPLLSIDLSRPQELLMKKSSTATRAVAFEKPRE